MSTRTQIAGLVSLMINAMIFGFGVIAILTIPSLNAHAAILIPELVVGADLTYKGGFAVPSVTFELAKNVKWKVEYDYFWSNNWRNGQKCQFPNAASCDNAGLFGYFHNRDQIYTSLTYLF